MHNLKSFVFFFIAISLLILPLFNEIANADESNNEICNTILLDNNSSINICVEPFSDTNFVGQDHTITVNFTNSFGEPLNIIDIGNISTSVNFAIVAGPNAGISGTCNGDVVCVPEIICPCAFTYNGSGGPGIDAIMVAVTVQTDSLTATKIIQVTKEWIAPLNVDVDIKPQSCPNPFNIKSFPKSNAVLPVAILGREDFDVNNIDIGSIRLAGVEPIRSSVQDVSTPAADGEECACTTAGSDGFSDLILKFDAKKIAAALGVIINGDVIPLTLTGKLLDETPIQGKDCVLIISK